MTTKYDFSVVKEIEVLYMVMKNKLGISDPVVLARAEEKISKRNAAMLFETGWLNQWEAGTFETLSKIHTILFGDIDTFAGKLRDVNIVKGNFRFAPIMYL